MAAGDAEILELLQRHGFPAEWATAAEPLSVLDDHALLVTEFVAGVPSLYAEGAPSTSHLPADAGAEGKGPLGRAVGPCRAGYAADVLAVEALADR